MFHIVYVSIFIILLMQPIDTNKIVVVSLILASPVFTLLIQLPVNEQGIALQPHEARLT